MLLCLVGLHQLAVMAMQQSLVSVAELDGQLGVRNRARLM
jgi:hypothetical protein